MPSDLPVHVTSNTPIYHSPRAPSSSYINLPHTYPHLHSYLQDESLIVWSVEQPMKKLQIPFAHMAGVTGVAFIGEDRLVSAGADHTLVTWKIPLVEAW